MTWTPATEALFFRGICEYPPTKETRNERALQIKDLINSSVKRFQKKFSLDDVSEQLNRWYNFEAEALKSDDEEPESAAKPRNPKAVKERRQSEEPEEDGEHNASEHREPEHKEGLTGRAARAKRRRHSEADEEQQPEKKEEEKPEEEEQPPARDEATPEPEESDDDTPRARRASRAARPSMTRSSLSPQRRARNATKVKQEPEIAEPPAAPSNDAQKSNRPAKRPTKNARPTVKREKSASPRNEISDSEGENDAAGKKGRRLPRKASEPAQPAPKRGSVKRKTEEPAEDTEAPKKARSRRAPLPETKEAPKKVTAKATTKARSNQRRHR